MFLRYLLLLLPICAGLSQDTAPVTPTEWGSQAGPWQASISASKSQYSAGEPIEVTGTLRNVSDRSVAFTRNVPSLFITDVRLPMPSWIPWRLKAQPLPASRIQPGEAFHVVTTNEPAGWETSRKYDLGTLVDMPVPGEYHVTLSTEQPTISMEEEQAAHRNPKVTDISNEIAITVVAAAK
jgi:hypothetical protein